MSRPRATVTLSVAAFIAYAVLLQGIGWNQTSHFSLVRALAAGTAQIDAYHLETGDEAYIGGHYYSNKAPGMALLTTPAYLVLQHTGATGAANRVTGTKAKGEVLVIWALSLLGAALPAALLVLVTGFVAARIGPEAATVTAATVGLATLILPFATMFFSHVLAAAFGFAAFAVLWRATDDAPARRGRIFLAGLLAGLAATSEYPAILIGVVLAGYVLAKHRTPRAVAQYVVGGVVGVLPVAVYNLWAFRSLTSLSYSNGVTGFGPDGKPVLGASPHFFGVDVPSLKVAAALLVSPKGVLVLTPVVAAGVFGLVALYRAGKRAEAVTAGAIVIANFVYVAGYYQPLGGWTPGPRYLIDCLPFLGFALALAYRRLPLTTLTLALASTLAMLLATTTLPQVSSVEGPGVWVDLLRSRHFAKTLISDFGAGRGIVGLLPFLVAVCLVAVVAWRASALRFDAREVWTAVAAAFGWICVVRFGVTLPPIMKTVGTEEAAAAACLAAAAVLLVVAVARSGPGALLAAVPLLPVLVPTVGSSPLAVLGSAIACGAVSVTALSTGWPERVRPSSAVAR